MVNVNREIQASGVAKKSIVKLYLANIKKPAKLSIRLVYLFKNN